MIERNSACLAQPGAKSDGAASTQYFKYDSLGPVRQLSDDAGASIKNE
jgi:hypothetical protein